MKELARNVLQILQAKDKDKRTFGHEKYLAIKPWGMNGWKITSDQGGQQQSLMGWDDCFDGEGIVEAADVADDKKRVARDMQGDVGVGTSCGKRESAGDLWQ